MSEEKYEIKNWQKMDVEVCRFVLDQAEKNLQEKISAADALISRALTILTISLPSLVFVVGYSLSNENRNSLLYHLSILSILILLIIIFRCINVYKLYDYKPLGNSPKNLIREDNVGDELKIFLVERIESMQRCIDFTKHRNDERVQKLTDIFKILKWSLVGIIVYTIFLYLPYYLLFLYPGQSASPCP